MKRSGHFHARICMIARHPNQLSASHRPTVHDPDFNPGSERRPAKARVGDRWLKNHSEPVLELPATRSAARRGSDEFSLQSRWSAIAQD